MTQDEFVRAAIGVPFVEHGRDYKGWDCWGLVLCAYRDVLGVTVPDFIYNDTNDIRALIRNFGTRSQEFWVKVDPQPLSVACIYRRGHVIHAGLVIGRRILHVEQGIETCLERIERFRVEGFYAAANIPAASVPV